MRNADPLVCSSSRGTEVDWTSLFFWVRISASLCVIAWSLIGNVELTWAFCLPLFAEISGFSSFTKLERERGAIDCDLSALDACSWVFPIWPVEYSAWKTFRFFAEHGTSSFLLWLSSIKDLLVKSIISAFWCCIFILPGINNFFSL